MFLIINKDKIDAYIVLFSSIIILFMLSKIMSLNSRNSTKPALNDDCDNGIGNYNSQKY